MSDVMDRAQKLPVEEQARLVCAINALPELCQTPKRCPSCGYDRYKPLVNFEEQYLSWQCGQCGVRVSGDSVSWKKLG